MKSNKAKKIVSVLILNFMFAIFIGSASQAKNIENVKSHSDSVASSLASAECPKFKSYINLKDCKTMASALIKDIIVSSQLHPKTLCKAIHYC
ncbi:MAG: hypothetical protein OXC48_02020 [Endozoicomonadaceae bacterium]|nr:hypothetical protein [Endozoicomonadaceae bacterium]